MRIADTSLKGVVQDTALTKRPLRSSLKTAGRDAAAKLPDLLCFSHLRWNFVYQRPQHLISRFAKKHRVFFIEEPMFEEGNSPRIEIDSDSATGEKIRIVVPKLPHGLDRAGQESALRELVDDLLAKEGIEDYYAWYYTPLALGFSDHLQPIATVYDCMDELSHFKGAPPELTVREADLFQRADVVFTGGVSLYEAKKSKHPNVHPFPSSVDTAHFGKAHSVKEDPADQASIPGPRIGFFGVIDERMDIELLGGVAAARPDWNFVILGPVVKIDPATLPKHPNIHYLGAKSYAELPSYLAGWDVAILPFARNESTKFISPTKTPEYLAAGRPVVSTSIRDVRVPYEELRLVRIADTVSDFVTAIEQAMRFDRGAGWQKRVDDYLKNLSWDETWDRMYRLVQASPDLSRRMFERIPM